MGFCRAFFGDFNDWLHQNHHFSFEPSGISKTKVLFQAVNILQVAEHVYLALGDEQNDFFVKTFERVKTGSEFLKKLEVANIKRMRGGEIEKVVQTWKKPKHIPFYFSQPLKTIREKLDPNLIELDKIFKDNNTPVDISLVLITESNGNNETEVVATDGSQATSLLLFVHPTNQPESEEAESLNQRTELILTEEAGPSTSTSNEESFSSPVRVFTKRMDQDCWAVDDASSIHKFLRGVRCILLSAKELKTGLSDWKLMLAHLLKGCDEEIEKNKKEFDALMSQKHKDETYGDRWRHSQDIVNNYFKRNSETIKSSNPERPIFLRCPPSVKFSVESTDKILKWILCDRKRVDGLLGVPFYGTNNPRGCPLCPETFSSADSKARHLLNEHRPQVLESLECPMVDCGKHFKNKNSLASHICYHSEKLLKMGQKRKPRDEVPKLVECPICHLCYKNKGSLATHMWRDHEKLKSDQKRKPEESVFATPEAKRTSQVQSHQHSYPSVSPPKDQHSDLYDLLESVTATTSYNSSMPYSDRLKPVHDYQEENSKIPSPKSTDLPTVSEEDFTIEELDDARMDEFIRSITQS